MSAKQGNSTRNVKMPRALRALNILLACLLVICAIAVAAMNVSRAGGTSDSKTASDGSAVSSDFSLASEPYDINPGQDTVVYTNYACPHCAELYFGAHEKNLAYTSRILLLKDEKGVFSTQRIVSGYMLKLSQEDPATFDAMERALFSNQKTWTSLSSEQVLTWLNQQSGKGLTESDLADSIDTCEQIERDAPDDLPFVPGVYQDKVRRDDLMYDLLERGAEIMEQQREGVEDAVR